MNKGSRGNVLNIAVDTSDRRRRYLERLFVEHSAAMRNFLSVRVAAIDELDDIVQETFIRLARMEDIFAKMPADSSGVRPYLFTIANRILIDSDRRKKIRRQYRDRQADMPAELGDNRVSNASPESLVLAREDLEEVRKVLVSIKPEWSRAFVLSRLRGMRYGEIAHEMGVSIRTVEKYIFKTLMQIKKQVKSEMDDSK
ncbi:RNA polymerase sigma factor [Porticoccus sp. W117]|uniref:RNA polymerase sigma factor n=1 Tax=Porticoccus sp. W117 TaxID=3054777 RepID=UPI00259AAF5F|nr:RNA polymerase sigma factor [Porticoccus sp. W117]MDM3870339.1 RNA polymerase sigma factor [Porticoccus sp. W117]